MGVYKGHEAALCCAGKAYHIKTKATKILELFLKLPHVSTEGLFPELFPLCVRAIYGMFLPNCYRMLACPNFACVYYFNICCNISILLTL